MSTVEVFSISAFGALVQEVLWWFNARHSLDAQRYRRLIRSPGYWITTILFTLIAGGVIVVWFMGAPPPSPRTLLLSGAGAPLLIKQGLKALTPQQHLGESEGFSLRDYLQ